MRRIEWGAIVFVTWLVAEAIWWALLGVWDATANEGMIVLAGVIIAILTCPDKRERIIEKEQSDGQP